MAEQEQNTMQNVQDVQSQTQPKDTEIKVPQADPHDPYAFPAAMPSSADREPRSFEVDDFKQPTRKQEDWRYTPIERIEEFFDVFEPSSKTSIEVTDTEGRPVDAGHVDVTQVAMGEQPSGTVMMPNDRVSAVEWASGKAATVVRLRGEIDTPVLVHIHGGGNDLDAVHLVIVAEDRAHGDVIVEHDGLARIAEGVEISTGADSHISTTFVQEWDKGSKHVSGREPRCGIPW